MEISFLINDPIFPVASLPFISLAGDGSLVTQTSSRSQETFQGSTYTRLYLESDLLALRTEFEHAKANGANFVAKWARNKVHIGQSRAADHMRWERWDADGSQSSLTLRRERSLSKESTGRAELSCDQNVWSLDDNDHSLDLNRSPEPLEPISRSIGFNAGYPRTTARAIIHPGSPDCAMPFGKLEDARTALSEDDRVTIGAPQQSITSILDCLADEVIRTRWGARQGVCRETASKFAADVLIGTHQQFLVNGVQQGDSLNPRNPSASHGLLRYDERVLSLQDMKWVFDYKVRPFTDRLQREPFLCSGCISTSKLYSFEGVIQHYAAKHTTDFSKGKVVVDWQARWPKIPPFKSNPGLTRQQFQGTFSTRTTGQRPYKPSHFSRQGRDELQEGEEVLTAAKNPNLGDPIGPSPEIPEEPSLQTSSELSGKSYSIPPGLRRATGPYHTSASGPHPVLGSWYSHQLEQLSRFAREVFSNLRSVALPRSIWMFVTIQQMAIRFKATSGVEPSLTMFIDALDQDATMRPLRDVHGLTCRSCVSSGLFRVAPNAKESPIVTGGNLYTLPQLACHFRSFHQVDAKIECYAGNAMQHTHDWKNDMIELPKPSVMTQLAFVNGMTKSKWDLIVNVLPEAVVLPAMNSGDMLVHSGTSEASLSHDMDKERTFDLIDLSTHFLFSQSALQKSSHDVINSTNTQQQDQYRVPPPGESEQTSGNSGLCPIRQLNRGECPSPDQFCDDFTYTSLQGQFSRTGRRTRSRSPQRLPSNFCQHRTRTPISEKRQ